MVTMFINAFPSPYYDRVVGNTASNFADLVVVSEKVELGIRCGKLAQINSNKGFVKKPTLEKKERRNQCHNNRTHLLDVRRLPWTLTPIPLYKTAFPITGTKTCGDNSLQAPRAPYPRSYDPGAWCDYHNRVVRHTTEKCWSLKHKVQDLLDGGQFRFQNQGPNAHNNPLPTHRVMATQ
ncbi:hypothetical protein CR513_28315, partial [Mucuna pruriens]